MTTLVHTFAPRGAARDLMSCRAEEVLLDGPAGTGKSRACLEKMHLMCLSNPEMRALMVRKTAASLATSALRTFERDVARESMIDGTVRYYGGSAREAPQYQYENGATITLGGMDNPLKVMSTEYDLIYVQEATELNVTGWEMLSSRLRNGRVSFQQMIADCNPQQPTHWLRQRHLEGRTVMFHSRHVDNPLYFNADGTETEVGAAYMRRLRALTGVRRLRLLEGIWAAAEGVIFDTFDPALHVVDKLPRGWETWPTYWAIDFGFTHPFVWQEWCVDPDGRGWLNQEVYRTRRMVEDHCAQIRELTKDRPRPVRILADHDAEDRATFERKMGVRTVAANKTVKVGLDAVMSRLTRRDDGRPGLYFRKGAVVERDQALLDIGEPTCTEDEMPAYIWNESKDAPVKERDHGCDTMRYFVAELDLRGETKVRTRTGRRR